MLNKLYITPKQWLHILRWTVYSLLLLFCMMVQTVVLGNRVSLHPNFVPLVLTCVCLREGPERGGTFALLGSLFWCLSGADYGSLSIFILTLLPVFGSALCRAVLANRFLPCLLICLITLLTEQITIFFLRFFFEEISLALLWQKLLPAAAVSMLFQPVIYLLVRQIAKIGDAYE